jgi:hypothetical protein
VTLTLGTNGGRDRGEVTGPNKLNFDQQMVVCIPQPGCAYTDKSLCNG